MHGINHTPTPNIVLITTDQQRFDTVPPYSPSFMRTPHFDFLAREGVRFDRAYTDTPVCVPSRVSLMTGKSVLQHGMIVNGETSSAMGTTDTLPGYLSTAGYQTIGIGKMHFSPQRARHGFQELILPEDYYRMMERSGNPSQPMRHGLGQNELYPGMATVPESLTLTSWIGDQCVEFIRERRDPTRPFFLWCSFSKPHPPLDPPEPYYSMYRSCAIPSPTVADWRDSTDRCPPAFAWNQHLSDFDRLPLEIIHEARAAYYGLVTHCDYVMGRVFAALLDVDLLDDALIVFASDHGEYLGDFRAGAKGFFHDVSARVPMAIRMPKSWDRRAAGEVVDSPVLLADLLPTLVTAAGGSIPAGVTGQDLVAVARGECEHPRSYVLGSCCVTPKPGFETDYLGITDGSAKLIWYPEGGITQLFDLEQDWREANDVSEDPAYAGQLAKLSELLKGELALHEPRYLTEDGEFFTTPPRDVPINEIRSRGWPGFHTDRYHLDVRH